jgi:hypothetical protein
MNVFFKRKKLLTISNHIDLENFILNNNFFKFFKKIPDSCIDKVNNQIKNTTQINFKEIKKWYRQIVNYPESVYNEDFLFMMGWEKSEITQFISEQQKKNSKILSDKKKINPEKFYDKSPKRIEYWVKKGFSSEEAKNLISESQKTFSKKICIQKYGEEEGVEIFQKRQKKWINSLHTNNKINEINKKKNSYSFDKVPIKDLIVRTSFLDSTKKIITECIDCDSISKFVLCVLTKIDVKTISDIIPYINSSIISNRYNTNKDTIKKTFFSSFPYELKCGLYGTPVYHNGIRFKSVKEYKLCLLFEFKKINYSYEIGYPNSHFKCDFYLPDYDVYIEYFGILDGKNFNKLDEKQSKYYDKMNKKILFCNENKIKLIYETDFTKLYDKILNVL